MKVNRTKGYSYSQPLYNDSKDFQSQVSGVIPMFPPVRHMFDSQVRIRMQNSKDYGSNSQDLDVGTQESSSQSKSSLSQSSQKDDNRKEETINVSNSSKQISLSNVLDNNATHSKIIELQNKFEESSNSLNKLSSLIKDCYKSIEDFSQLFNQNGEKFYISIGEELKNLHQKLDSRDESFSKILKKQKKLSQKISLIYSSIENLITVKLETIQNVIQEKTNNLENRIVEKLKGGNSNSGYSSLDNIHINQTPETMDIYPSPTENNTIIAESSTKNQINFDDWLNDYFGTDSKENVGKKRKRTSDKIEKLPPNKKSKLN